MLQSLTVSEPRDLKANINYYLNILLTALLEYLDFLAQIAESSVASWTMGSGPVAVSSS